VCNLYVPETDKNGDTLAKYGLTVSSDSNAAFLAALVLYFLACGTVSASTLPLHGFRAMTAFSGTKLFLLFSEISRRKPIPADRPSAMTRCLGSNSVVFTCKSGKCQFEP